MEFITRDDIYERLSRYQPPVGEAYYLRRHPGRLYSQVGISFTHAGQVARFPLFDVYTGSQELYANIRDMILSVAEELCSMFIFDQWSENDTQPSEKTIEVAPRPRDSGGACCGPGGSGTCPGIIEQSEMPGVVWIP